MNRIYNAAKQCGYLKDIIQPLDPKEAKKILETKNKLNIRYIENLQFILPGNISDYKIIDI